MMPSRFTAMLCATAAAVVAAMPAAAEESVKIAYVDPLSGGGANIGEVGLKTSRRRHQCAGRHSRQQA